MGDDFRDLTQPGPERAAGDLARQIADALDEPPGRVAVEPQDEDEEMAWLLREGVRLSSFNLRAVGAAEADRRAGFVEALAGLVRRYEELRPTLEGLEPGNRYVVDYKHERLRRVFRVKGTLVDVSPWQPAEGPSGGGWTLTLESRPRFGEPSRFRVQTDVLTRIVPDPKRRG
ncbi:MAG TPA: hypothetical protein VLE71_07805 [Actinomycetota bacterium]|nr:hypothetical protein [Actinomycetota bacterium]